MKWIMVCLLLTGCAPKKVFVDEGAEYWYKQYAACKKQLDKCVEVVRDDLSYTTVFEDSLIVIDGSQ